MTFNYYMRNRWSLKETGRVAGTMLSMKKIKDLWCEGNHHALGIWHIICKIYCIITITSVDRLPFLHSNLPTHQKWNGAVMFGRRLIYCNRLNNSLLKFQNFFRFCSDKASSHNCSFSNLRRPTCTPSVEIRINHYTWWLPPFFMNHSSVETRDP